MNEPTIDHFLVELRQEGREARGLRCGELCLQGADEIERLRALLAEEAKFWERHGPGAET